MSEQPQTSAPNGFKWTRSWFGFGPPVLVPDNEFPLPPEGFRVQRNFWTGKPELVKITSEGVIFLEPNATPTPAPPTIPAGLYVQAAPISQTRLDPGIEWLGNSGNDAPLDRARARSTDHQVTNRDPNTAAIF